ncbi:hypothetical protein DJ499_25225, partial [Klebsiella pneumoniae]|uniref:HK97-gp10 family putative phage morphogenesis protein n=1 Tax=Klebsiella pneumoniae TaxID=573 RepID=UPI0011E431D0
LKIRISLRRVSILRGEDHWRFLEFGTEHAAARPIIRPALNGVDADVINVFALELEKSIDRAVRRAAKKGTPV